MPGTHELTEADWRRADRSTGLRAALQVAVPLWIHRWRHASPERRCDRARQCADLVASHGDSILYHQRHIRARHTAEGSAVEGKPSTAEAFNHLAEGVALVAYQPGGVTVFGLHFEVSS